MASEPEAVLALVVRARRRLRLAAAAEALAGPAAGFLIVVAAVLAIARAAGRTDLPTGLLGAAAAIAALVAFARLKTLLPGTVDAALHLDRALGAEERFVTVLETGYASPAVAAWAARGALARTRDGALARALAMRPPRALVPVLLAATLAAGLALLPAGAVADASSPGSSGGTVVAATGAAGSGAAPSTAAAPAPGRAAPATPAASAAPAAPVDPAAALETLRARAEAEGKSESLRLLASARRELEIGDGDAARRLMGEAAALLGVAGTGVPVPGATGGGVASAGPGASPAGEAFRPLPVPLRAREAVRRYFGSEGPR